MRKQLAAGSLTSERLKKEVEAVESLDLDLLRKRWRRVMGRPAPTHLSRGLLIRILAYRHQVNVLGDLDRDQLAKALPETLARLPTVKLELAVTRIDVDDAGCHVVWTNTTERVPSVVSKVSARTGLVYTFTKDPDPTNTTADAWFWAALDFRTGALVWKQLAGTGFNFNNHYAGIVLSRDGTAYLGAVGGVLAIRDGQ